MSTILIKDYLRASVEAASGGAQTVLYTTKGQPTFVNIVDKFDLSTIDATLSGTHPAFIVNGVEKDRIYIGTYPGKVSNGEFLSLPNVDPTASLNLDQAVAYARANGAGHHIVTAAEWGALAIQCQKNGVKPLGNTYNGRTSTNSALFGRRSDGGVIGVAPDVIGHARTLTGSGPVQWRHNQKYNGISDLSGNIFEWCAGYRLFAGEVQVIANNNAAMLTTDLSAASAEWKAIDGSNGNLITPNGYGTTPNSVRLALGASTTTNDYTIAVPTWSNLTTTKNSTGNNPVSSAALKLLKALGLFPINTSLGAYGEDSIIYPSASNGETVLCRGGYWNSGSGGGIFNSNQTYIRSRVDVAIGARPAYYQP